MSDYSNRPARTQAQIDGQKKIFDALWSFVNEHKPCDIPNKTCLEFGAGRFGYIDHYKKFFQKSYALDIYDFSDCYEGDVHYLLSEDQLTIPLSKATVDMVVSHSVLEHVMDIRHTIQEIDRVLKVGGFAFLTVSPLYWSYNGGHLYTKARKRLENWEHLDPSSEYFIEGRKKIEINLGGFLNRLTMSELLEAIGRVPWSIEKLDIRGNNEKVLPHYLDKYDRPLVDFHTREFRLLARKAFRYEDNKVLTKDL